MEIAPHLEHWWRTAAALLIGALIGQEREFIQQRSGDTDFPGIAAGLLTGAFRGG